MCCGIVDQGKRHNGDSMGKRECLIPVWRGKGRAGGERGGRGAEQGERGGREEGKVTSEPSVKLREREAKLAEDLSSFICPYFLQNVICAI